MLTLFMLLAISGGSAAQPSLECEPGDGIPAEYCQLMHDGLVAVQGDRFTDAKRLLENALRVPLFEVPNYALTGYLALAYCGAGDTTTGQSLLRDFECMLEVDAGERACYTGTAGAAQRGSGLTDRCFETMCGEIFLSYYEHPTASTLEHIKRLRLQAVAIREGCKP